MQKMTILKTKSSTCPVCGQRTESDKIKHILVRNLQGAIVSEGMSVLWK